jgi:hypothetical protein
VGTVKLDAPRTGGNNAKDALAGPDPGDSHRCVLGPSPKGRSGLLLAVWPVRRLLPVQQMCRPLPRLPLRLTAAFAAQRVARIHALRGASAGRPMPWVNRPPQFYGLKGRENPRQRFSRPFRPLGGSGAFFTQGIGLRPQPRARLSRPVGPVLLFVPHPQFLLSVDSFLLIDSRTGRTGQKKGGAE